MMSNRRLQRSHSLGTLDLGIGDSLVDVFGDSLFDGQLAIKPTKVSCQKVDFPLELFPLEGDEKAARRARRRRSRGSLRHCDDKSCDDKPSPCGPMRRRRSLGGGGLGGGGLGGSAPEQDTFSAPSESGNPWDANRSLDRLQKKQPKEIRSEKKGDSCSITSYHTKTSCQDMSHACQIPASSENTPRRRSGSKRRSLKHQMSKDYMETSHHDATTERGQANLESSGGPQSNQILPPSEPHNKPRRRSGSKRRSLMHQMSKDSIETSHHTAAERGHNTIQSPTKKQGSSIGSHESLGSLQSQSHQIFPPPEPNKQRRRSSSRRQSLTHHMSKESMEISSHSTAAERGHKDIQSPTGHSRESQEGMGGSQSDQIFSPSEPCRSKQRRRSSSRRRSLTHQMSKDSMETSGHSTAAERGHKDIQSPTGHSRESQGGMGGSQSDQIFSPSEPCRSKQRRRSSSRRRSLTHQMSKDYMETSGHSTAAERGQANLESTGSPQSNQILPPSEPHTKPRRRSGSKRRSLMHQMSKDSTETSHHSTAEEERGRNAVRTPTRKNRSSSESGLRILLIQEKCSPGLQQSQISPSKELPVV